MNITDELRKYAQRYKNSHDAWSGISDDLDQIADRIDAEHEESTSEFWQRINAVPVTDENMAEHGFVRLPKDADGEYIHIGDEMEGVDKYDTLKEVRGKVITVSFESDGTIDVAIRAWNSDGRSWHRAYLDPDASVYRHHHEPTIEDVLREFAEKVIDSQIPSVHPTYEEAIAEYAAKLRLADNGKEQ